MHLSAELKVVAVVHRDIDQHRPPHFHGPPLKGRIRRVYFPGQLRKLSLEILKAEVETERAWNIRGSSRSRKILANRSLYNCHDFAFSAEVAFRRAARAR